MARKLMPVARFMMPALLLMVVLLIGCARPEEPQVPKARAAQALQVPAPQPVNNPNIMAFVRIRDLNQVIGRLSDWVAIVNPMISASTVSMQLQAVGIVLSDFRAGESISVFLFDPEGQWRKPPAAALLPIAYASQTVQTMVRNHWADGITSIGQDTIMARDTAALAKAVGLAKPLAELNKAPLSVDFQLFFNTDALMSKYGPVMRRQAEALKNLMAPAMASQPNPVAFQQMMETELKALLDLLDQTQAISVGLDFPPEAVELSAIARAKPGSGLETVLKRGLVSAPDLSVFLDKNAAFKGQFAVRDMKGLIQLEMKYITLAVGPGHDQDLKQMQADAEEFAKLGPQNMAIAMDFSPENKLVYDAVIMTDDSKLLADLVRTKMMKWMNAGPLHDFYKNMGMDMKVTQDPATRKVHGWEVTRYTMKLTMGPKVPAEQRAQFEKMFGVMTVVEVCPMGPLYLVSFNRPLDVLADRVFKPENVPSMDAVRGFPAGAVYYFDVNLAGMMRMMRATMPPEQAGLMPTFPANAPAITGAGYHTDGLAWYRLKIPRGLVTSLAAMHGGGPVPTGAQVGPSNMPPSRRPAKPKAPPR